MLNKLHVKIGDLWWYSAMIFFACRSGDAIQAFIGLWLVPKYIGPNELGAVLPIQQLCGLFSVPLAILAVVFSKFVNSYATHGEYAKVKSFIHDILLATAVVFLICILVAYLIVPHFYTRLRLSSGSLTILILVTGFTGNIASLFVNALQGLKRFKTLTIVNLIGAPIRLITLLIAMPFRALSGYLLGQITPPATATIITAFSIRKGLRGIPLDTSWRHDIPSILRYLWPVTVFTASCALFNTISTTVYRQRLPEIESAAYYLISRFAEIAGYVGLSMMVILFPLAAEAHEQGRENTSFLKHTCAATIVTTCVLSVIFKITGPYIFSLTDTWSVYLPYVHLLPWVTLITGASTALGSFATYEMACRRFASTFIIAGFNIFITLILLTFTGWDFFRGTLPDYIIDWIAEHHLVDLTRITWFYAVSVTIQIIFLFIFHATNKR